MQPLPEDLSGTEVDHIIPRSRGGPNLAWNRQMMHLRCNRIKHCALTSEAAALAEERGVVLREPPRATLRRNAARDPGAAAAFREYLDAIPAAFALKCCLCGCRVVVFSDPQAR